MPETDKALQRRITKALDQIQPDETAKDRMYLEIMRRASLTEHQAQQKKTPWYRRWQTSAGICTAAMMCVVVAVAAIHGRMPDSSSDRIAVVDTSVTTSVAAEETVPETETTTVGTEGETTAKTEETLGTEADALPSDVETSGEADAVQTETDTQASQNGQTGTAATEAQGNGTETAPPQQTDCPPKETTVPKTTGTKAKETIPASSSTTAASDAERETETAATTAPETSELPVVTEVPIRQNIYLYYELTWNGVPYATQYMPCSSYSLEYVGYGVTSGADVEDTHTVLIYTIDGVDPQQQLAVQYAGEETYYLFNAQIID